MADVIYLTFDVDWAPEAVLADTLQRLETAGAKATFFATHDSPLLKALDRNSFEIGLHPNYFNVTTNDFLTPLLRLKELFPDAVGGRSHGLFVSSRILGAYAEAGLSYESNIFLYRHLGLQAVRRNRNMVSTPFIWSDDKLLELSEPFELSQVPIRGQGLKVINFHPVHVFINTTSEAHYADAKKGYQDVAWLNRVRARGISGIGTLLDQVLQCVKAGQLRTALLREAAVVG